MKKRTFRLSALLMTMALLVTFVGCRKTPGMSSGEWLSEREYYYYDANGNWVEVADPSIFANNGIAADADGDTQSGGKPSKPVDSSAYQTLVDYCGDDKFNKIFEYKNIKIDDSYSDVLEDNARFTKYFNEEIGYFTYKVDGIAEFYVDYSYGVAERVDNKISFFVSKDNMNWTEVKPQDELYLMFNGTSWLRTRAYFGDIDPKNQYLKIQIGMEGKIVYNPNVCTVQINGLTDEVLSTYGMYNSKIAPKTIYVDSVNGKDTNSGTSEKEPLKTLYGASKRVYSPGSKILLKAGCEFSGSLEIIGNGSAKSPIVVTSYGSGNKPIINARGGSAISYYGEYITFTGLEITNKTGSAGITVKANKPGATRGITVTKCDFKNINVSFNFTGHGNAGVCLSALGKEPVWFDGVSIYDNTFKKVARCGIVVTSDWTGKDKNQTWGCKNDIDAGEWFGSKNIVIRNNILDEIGGDGILVMGGDGALVEKNVVSNSGLFKDVGKIHWVAIWCHSSNNCVFQYNEVYGNSGKNNGNDLQAFDADIACENCIFQYNYSHDNDGGFMLICANEAGTNAQTTGTIVRYNLSVNDGVEGGQIIDITGSAFDSQIYNNTIYQNKYNNKLIQFVCYGNEPTPSKNTVITNNIFYADGVNLTYNFNKIQSATFNNNVYQNVQPPAASGQVSVMNSITDRIELTGAGATGNGLEKIAANYKPKTDFLTTRGVAVANSGGKDLLGKAVDDKLLGALAK